MNFKQSLVVLILTFLLLDIFLAYNVVTSLNQRSFSQSDNINILEQMKNDNIVVPVLSVAEETASFIKTDRLSLLEQIGQLPNQSLTFENNILHSTLSEPVQLGTTDITAESVANLDKFVNESVFHGDQYSFFTYNPVTRKIVYTQQVGRIPILDGSSQLVFSLSSSGEVTAYDQTYAGTAEVQGSARTLITAQKAVELLYLNNRISSNTTILKVRLTYSRTLTLTDMYVYGPTWYIELQQVDGKIEARRVDAVQGSLLSDDEIETFTRKKQLSE